MRIITEQAPSAKPVSVNAKLTENWKTLIEVPDYDVPVVGFGTERRIAPGVAEISSALLASNTTQTSAGLYIRVIKALGAEKSPLFASVTNAGDFDDAASLLTVNKSFVQAEVGAFVEDNYPNLLTADQMALCTRDAGLILDALVADLLDGGTLNTEEAALAYFSGAVAILPTPQVVPTIKAILHIGELAADIIRQSSITAQNDDGVTQVFSGSTTVSNPGAVDTIVNGLIAALNDTILIPKPSSEFDSITNVGGFTDAVDIIQLNRTFIQEEVTAYVTDTYPNLLTSAQLALCKRDTGLIVDALTNDLTDGGTLYAIDAALAYYNNAISILPEAQVAPTVNALLHLGSLIGDIIRQDTVSPVLNDEGETQVFDAGITVANPSNIDTITDALISAINDTLETPVLSDVFVIAENVPVEPRDTLIFPLNGQFLLTGDRLQVKTSDDNAVTVTLSYTEGQSEEDDIPGGNG